MDIVVCHKKCYLYILITKIKKISSFALKLVKDDTIYFDIGSGVGPCSDWC